MNKEELFMKAYYLRTKKLILTLLFIGTIYSIGYSQITYITINRTKYESLDFFKTSEVIHKGIEKSCLSNAFIKIVDRDVVYLVDQERNIQKNEAFIDGVYVKQDKAIGASLLVVPVFEEEGKTLSLSIVDVETNELVYKNYYKLKSFLNSNNELDRPNYFRRYIEEIMTDLLAELHLYKNVGIEIASIEESKKSKAVTLLVYCPAECELVKDQELVVFYEHEDKVTGLQRSKNVGLIKISNVENKKVSTAKVKKGGEEIYSLIQKQFKLKCKYEN